MKIAETLERHGTTLRDVARAIGMKPSTLQSTIDGNPTIGTLRKIAEAARCPLAEFFLDEPGADGYIVIPKNQQPTAQPTAAGASETTDNDNVAAASAHQPSDISHQSSDISHQPSATGYDLLTIDPVTGESRKYRLVR